MDSKFVNVPMALQSFSVRILDNGRDVHFWIELEPGVSTPLATINEPDGSSYCYFGRGSGEKYSETRVYGDGSIVTR